MQLPVTTPDEMAALLAEIVDLKARADGFYDPEPVRAVLLPPATPAELAALAARLARAGLPFPPSYRLLLSACDGAEFLFEDDELRLLSAGQSAQPRANKAAAGFAPLDRFVFAAGKTAAFVAFDTSAGAAEPQVVQVSADGEEERSANLVAFLTGYRDFQRDALAVALADRKGLADD